MKNPRRCRGSLDGFEAQVSEIRIEGLEDFPGGGLGLARHGSLFDVFEGGRVPEGKVSLAFRVVYRSDERTLTEAEVSEVENALLQRLEKRVGASLREA